MGLAKTMSMTHDSHLDQKDIKLSQFQEIAKVKGIKSSRKIFMKMHRKYTHFGENYSENSFQHKPLSIFQKEQRSIG